MHTSSLTAVFFFAAIAAALAAQIGTYYCTQKDQRTGKQKIALGVGLLAVLLSAVAGWRADTDWATLPKSPEGLQPGQLWDDGGIPAIVQQSSDAKTQ